MAATATWSPPNTVPALTEPDQDLGIKSLSQIRSFHEDPSEIGWAPRPYIMIAGISAGLVLDHSCQPVRDEWYHNVYVASGELHLPQQLKFLGWNIEEDKTEICQVWFGRDYPVHIANVLTACSERAFDDSRMDDTPCISTRRFEHSLKTMIPQIFQAMVIPSVANPVDFLTTASAETEEQWSSMRIIHGPSEYTRPRLTVMSAVTYSVLFDRSARDTSW